MVVLQNLSTSAFLPGESNPVLLLCMILGYCLYYSSVHTLDNPWRDFFLTLWTEAVENIVSVPAKKNKIEISYFLSITTLAFCPPHFKHFWVCFSGCSHVCFLPSIKSGLFIILFSLLFKNKTGHNQNSLWHPPRHILPALCL